MLANHTTSFSIWKIFKSHIPRFCLIIFCDILCPLVIFFVLENHMKTVYALLIAGVPPLLMILIKAFVSCTFDVLGFLVLLSFIISALLAILTHNDIIFLFGKSLVTLTISICFGLTLIPCLHWHWWKPLAFFIYQETIPIERKDLELSESIFDRIFPSITDNENEIKMIYEWIYKYFPSFRLACFLITYIWFIGFLFEFLTRLILILILQLSIGKIFLYGHIILSSITIFCAILTVICITNERQQTLKSIQLWKKDYVDQFTSV